MKATQGSRFVDPTLARNWKGIDESNASGGRLLKGAYHFLTADTDAAAQARGFVVAMKTLTSFDGRRDLPPCLDLEWDLQSDQGRILRDERGRGSDRWKAYRPADIMQKVLTWLRIVSSEFGVTPWSLTRNTAVPCTRVGGLTNTASRKLFKSIASSRSRACINRRPCFQVIISVNMTPPIATGNQPPSNTFTTLALKYTKSTMKKNPVAAKHNDHGYFQP